MFSERFYVNPVVERDFPDPFVYKFCGEYFAVGTGFWHDGGVFGILKSRDLINWTECGSAINPTPFPDSPCYWAAEVFYDNGKFYLYYSVGDEENMEIRVAVSDFPDRDFVDAGAKLTTEKFAIDAHVFVDDDNSRWLFYATDFVEHSHIGTGTVRDKLLSPFKLAGNPQPVTRAGFDWQVYDPNRANKGGVRWHTIEGSTVLKRKNVYYQMFSGGNWQNISYGVSYATTRDINQTEEWRQIADGETVYPILRTIPGKVVGPGHNSVVRGTDNRQLYCVYHRWNDELTERRVAIDKLDFVGERMLISGASYDSQTAPSAATFVDFFDTETESGLGVRWEHHNDGHWLCGTKAAITNPLSDFVEGVCPVRSNCFVAELSMKALDFAADSASGWALKNGEEIIFRCLLLPSVNKIKIIADSGVAFYNLPAGFDARRFHLWRIEIDHLRLKIHLDEASFRFEELLPQNGTQIAMISEKMSAAFAGFALTVGFEELFSDAPQNLQQRGWNLEETNQRDLKTDDNSLQFDAGDGAATIWKECQFENFEFAVTARLAGNRQNQGCYGFQLSDLQFTIEGDNNSYFLQAKQSGAAHKFDLPAGFAIDQFQLFRLRSVNGMLIISCETDFVGEIAINPQIEIIGLYVENAVAEFDMVRVTVVN